MSANDYIEQALAASDPSAWCERNRQHLSEEFVQEVKSRLDKAVLRDPQQANKLADLAIASAETAGIPRLVALAKRSKAQVLHQSGACAEAIPLYKEASQTFLQAGEEVEASRTLIGAIDALSLIGQIAEALKTAEECTNVFRRHGEELNEAKVALNVGNLYHKLNRNEEAGRYYAQARSIFARRGNRQFAALADTNLGNVATNLCNFSAAHAYYRRASSVLNELGADLPAAMNDVDIGWLHFLEGDYLHALAVLSNARRKFAENKMRRHVATCDLDLSDVYLALNDTDRAEKHVGDALEVFEPLGFLVDAGKCQLVMGIIEIRRGNLARAEASLARAREKFVRSGNRALELATRLQQAEMHLASEDPKVALQIAEEVSRELRTLGMRMNGAHAEVLLGRILTHLEDWTQARSHFETAVEVGKSLNSRPILIEGYLGLGQVLKKTESLLAAIEKFEEARKNVNSVTSVLHPEELKTNYLDSKADLYAELVEAVLDSAANGAADTALELSEEAKSQSLVDKLAGRVEARAVGQSEEGEKLAARVRSLQKELSALQSAAARHEYQGGQRAEVLAHELKDKISVREAELSEALIELESLNSEYVSLIKPRAISSDAIKSIVPPGSAMVEYFGTPTGFAAFVITRDNIAVQRMPVTLLELKTAVEDLLFEISRYGWTRDFSESSRPGTSNVDRLFERLHSWLVAPLGRLPRHVIIVPHGPLHHVPFHALKGPRGHMVQEHVISYAPSAAVLAYCQKRDRHGLKNALVVGPARSGLEHAEQEVRDVAGHFGSSKTITGLDATLENLRAESAQYDVLHIAAHSAVHEERPLLSGIPMADGNLSILDVYELRLSTSLVALSTCQSAANSVSRSDEVFGLARGFLYAGSSSVLASLWQVHDRSTAEFMRVFYERLTQGAGRAEALRLAQLEMMGRHPHPFHWAPFALIGMW